MRNSIYSQLEAYLVSNAAIDWQTGSIPKCQIPIYSKGMQANEYFFSNPLWNKKYLDKTHRSLPFKQRWQAAMGSWDDKIVVDIGCGPGNVYATVGGSPKLLIGIDISLGALKLARNLGYTPILADAHHLPLIDGFADIVVLNATIHHCDDMQRVLAEAARILRPGGLLFTDEDPQVSAWQLKSFGLYIRNIRYPIYRAIKSKHYLPSEERIARWKSEVQNQIPGDGVTSELYHQVLQPLGFDINLYLHNYESGAEVLNGEIGKSSWRLRLSQWLSGINPNSPEAAQSIMCIARRN
ncbi:methylase involved in ubiquinone/menaquinone biosynthesis [Rivularia sp. PCC 7116]|uniref:class I SAM-dependent methyltransferase n=1 Tax=Rivularia sp. PCC 7116 TaxID=373994 RepID=UPI00029EC6B0|nr:methyltransferase domain-containing protein [Rivularia sp. PCC 7116]AFY56860.1 methylase involved in ubiquinone/menaquinone biosynthesis [Rivularia sp. PCC 7116]